MLQSFKIENYKSIGLTECTQVPLLMIIAGINGAGKSSLLYAIKTRKGTIKLSGKVLYIPPHRVWARQKIQAMHLWEARRTYQDATAWDSLAGTNAVRITAGERTADSADESTKFIKYSLGQIEVQRQNAISKSVDKKVDNDKLKKFTEIYDSLKELTRVLLPHLEFERISLDDKTNVKCIWKRAEGIDLTKGTSIEVDIDDLSSGEKAILTLFLPFIEYQIEKTLKKLKMIQ